MHTGLQELSEATSRKTTTSGELEALPEVDAGIDAPYSCREGECGSCACTLLEGTVDPGVIDALDPDDYILGCPAKPTSPTLRVEF